MACKRSGVRVPVSPPRFMTTFKYKTINDALPLLPRRSYTSSGELMEPVTLVIIGSKKNILSQFGQAGWYMADSVNFSSSLKSAIATVFNSSYITGPMWPSYISNTRHRMGFERPTRSDTFRRRHHLRLWKTKIRINKQILWIGTISYDRSIGLREGSLMPTHHISSTLKSEENFLARTFRIVKPKYITLGKAESGVIKTGDNYVWDGKALVIDLSKHAH